MRFPLTIRFRRSECKIYGKRASYPFYRVAAYVAGKRRMASYRTYSEARTAADKLVRELAAGSQATALTAKQASDALAALQRLEAFFAATGKRVSLLRGISEYCEATAKLGEHSLTEAAETLLRTVASVKRQDIGEAVEEYLRGREAQTHAPEGQRAQLSAKYFYNRAIQLRRFAGAFPATAICDLKREHLDLFLQTLRDFSPKARNHYRAGIKQFLEWATRRDLLPRDHRLGEADTMRPERANTAEVLFYTPAEFRALLETAEGPMRAMIALAGLAGLRVSELLRLTWGDVFRVPGHIEITAGKSKTRQRRLVEIVPALAGWLEPLRNATGKIWPLHESNFQWDFRRLSAKAGVPRRTNGLRHAFCTYHYAQRGNEHLTSAQAGNSPAVIHAHYKGLATKTEAEKWFAVCPTKPADNVIPLPTTAAQA